MKKMCAVVPANALTACSYLNASHPATLTLPSPLLLLLPNLKSLNDEGSQNWSQSMKLCKGGSAGLSGLFGMALTTSMDCIAYRCYDCSGSNDVLEQNIIYARLPCVP